MTDFSDSVNSQTVRPIDWRPVCQHYRPMALKDRIADLVRKDGRTQQQIEGAAKLSKGYLTRLLNGERLDLRGKTAQKLAGALGVSTEELQDPAEPGSRAARIPGVRPTLQQLPGYADLEIQVARLAPDLPVSVFAELREVSLFHPPALTVEFLMGMVSLLHKQGGAVEETEEIRQRIERKKSPNVLRNSALKG